MSDRYPVRDPSCLYLRTKQREGGNELVFSLAIKNTALIQWHKLKKETPCIAYIDMLNGIIPDHALKISGERDRIEGRLSKHCSVASIIDQILNRKGNFKNRKGHEEKLCRLTILKSKVIPLEKWEVDLCAIQSKLEKEICNWKAKYENLVEEKEKLAEKMLSEIGKDYAREKERTRKPKN